MNPTTSDQPLDALLDEVLGQYLVDLDEGRAPSRDDLIRRYPSIAEPLRRFFGNEDCIRLVSAGSLDRIAGPEESTAGAGEALTRVVRQALQVAIPSAGTRLRDYELLEEIARGGMGIVFKARQTSADRVVALKLVGLGQFASAADTERFRNEIRAVGALDHPNIVPIYEVGDESGLNFFSMKFLEGGTLARRLDEYRQDPRRGVRLVIEVARAVLHAHQRGILHRDLKPGNVLLDAQGVPYVTDFGLAKHLDSQQELTLSGTILGTPSYMAPEQARPAKRPGEASGAARLTTESDIYGLGAILYATLTGEPPFRGNNVFETLDLVRRADASPPSRRNRKVDRDLDAICLKCLEKEPPRRYASASELIADLESWERHEPIMARPIGTLSRVGRWCRRNPISALMSLALGLCFGALFTGLSIANYRISRAQARTVVALETARHAVEAMYADFGAEWDDDELGLSPSQRRLAESAVTFYRNVADDDRDQAAARMEVAAAAYRMGVLQQRLGDAAAAVDAYDRCLEVLERRRPGEPPAAEHFVLRCLVLRQKGSLAAGLGNRDDAIVQCRRGQQAGEEGLKSFPHARDLLAAHADCVSHLAKWLGMQGRYEEARQLAPQAVATYRMLAAADPSDLRLQTRRGFATNVLLRLLIQQQDHEPALPLAIELVEVWRKRLDAFPQDANTALRYAGALQNYARLLADAERHEEALEPTREAIALLEGLSKSQPKLASLRMSLAALYAIEGAVLNRKGDQAVAPMKRSAQYLGTLDWQSLSEDDLHAAASSLYSLGNALVYQGQVEEARRHFEQARTMAEALVQRHPQVVNHEALLGMVLHNYAGTLPASPTAREQRRQLYERAIPHQQFAADRLPRHPQHRAHLIVHYCQLAHTLDQMGRRDEARRLLEARAGEFASWADSPDAPGLLRANVAEAHNLLATWHEARKEYEQAVSLLDRAIAWVDSARTEVPADFPAATLAFDAGRYRHNRANSLRSLGRFDEARQGYEEALPLEMSGFRYRHALSPALAVANTYRLLGQTYSDLKDRESQRRTQESRLEFLREASAAQPKSAELISQYGRASADLAWAMNQKLSEVPDMLRLFRQNFDSQAAAIRLAPSDQQIRQRWLASIETLTDAYAQLGDHEACALFADECSGLARDSRGVFRLAASYATCVKAVHTKKNLAEDERAALADKYAAAALVHFRRAIELGHRKSDLRTGLKSLEPIAHRPEYAELAARLETSAPSSNPNSNSPSDPRDALQATPVPMVDPAAPSAADPSPSSPNSDTSRPASPDPGSSAASK